MRIAHRLVAAIAAMLAVPWLRVVSVPAFQNTPSLEAEPPFVVCSNQRYALCAAASCFVYNEVAYCRCDVMKGDSISLQLDFETPKGEKDVCDLNAEGKKHGSMVSTYSLPADVVKGGTAAVYTCPGGENKGSGVAAPVAYGQCDGGLCFHQHDERDVPGLQGQARARDRLLLSDRDRRDAGELGRAGVPDFWPLSPEGPGRKEM
jgi:hypothetical protein